ncbi:MAG: hypothetical protein BGO65_03600 [Afipia sp. 64-13]|nr:MAG: hypothetical protein BGO65_03600 [Afipia sp. 64-13]
MAGLDPAIHDFCCGDMKTWMSGINPGMTALRLSRHDERGVGRRSFFTSARSGEGQVASSFAARRRDGCQLGYDAE